MERYLGIDYGEKRLGIAISDRLGLTAQPKAYVSNSESMMNNIKHLISEYEITHIVLGLPLDTRGGKTLKSDEVESFGKILNEELNLPVLFYDERYSTKAVSRHLIDHGVRRNKRKEKVDSLAAAFFLQGFLDGKENSNKNKIS